MGEEDTSYYWRRMLRLDEEVEEDFLQRLKSPLNLLRPIFFALVSLLAKFYFRMEVFGVKNIPLRPPYIIAPNHCSAMDFPSVAWAMPKGSTKDLYVITTKYFYDNPVARVFIKIAANALRIDTTEDFFPAFQGASKILRKGKSVYIHPEGTRSPDGNLVPFKVGVGVLALELGVPIVPVYIHGTFKALPTGAIIPRPVKVTVSFGKPITMEGYQQKKESEKAYYIYKEITNELRNRMVELKEKSG